MLITFISNLFQFVLLGILVQIGNTHTELRQKHKGKYLWGFLIASVVIVALASYGAYRQSLKADALAATLGAKADKLQGKADTLQASADALQKKVDALEKGVTGGDSFPVVNPVYITEEKANLTISNMGDSVLSGVTVDISCWGPPVAEQKEFIGTIPAHNTGKIVRVLDINKCHDTPPVGGGTQIVNGAKIALFWIDISAQNGTYHELLQFWKGQNCRFWRPRFVVVRMPPISLADGGVPDVVGDAEALYWVPPRPQYLKGVGQKCG